MLSMPISRVVSSLVDQVLIGKRGDEKALHFHFDLGISHYVEGDSYDSRCGLHLLYHLKPGYGSVSVFSGVTPRAFSRVGQVQQWRHETTHDSCWRDESIFSTIYFQMANEVNALMVKDGLPEVAPVMMTEHNFPHLFGAMYDWVAVEIMKDPDDPCNYRRTVKVIQ